MGDPAIVDHCHVVPKSPGEVEVLFHQQHRRLGDFAERCRYGGDDGGRQPLGRLVRGDQCARLDDGARDCEHLFWSARQRPGLLGPEGAEGWEELFDAGQATLVERALGGGEHEVLLVRQPAEDLHLFPHIGDAEPGDLGGMKPGDVPAPEPHRPGRGPPQPDDRAQRGRLACPVVPQEHEGPALGHAE